jgi:hypothetical protein
MDPPQIERCNDRVGGAVDHEQRAVTARAVNLVADGVVADRASPRAPYRRMSLS